MEIAPFILKEFKPFTLETSISEVKEFFHETTFSHFPIVEKNELLGLISETDIQGIYNGEQKLDDYKYLFNLFFAQDTDNLLELIKVFASNETNLIPVLNEEKKYSGYLDLIDILHVYNDTPFLKIEGVVLLIEKAVNDYSFSQICQIIEANNGKILGLFISESNPNTVRLTVKFSSPDVNEIIQSFRRYNYTILSKHKEDFHIEDLKERSEYLQKYLNI